MKSITIIVALCIYYANRSSASLVPSSLPGNTGSNLNSLSGVAPDAFPTLDPLAALLDDPSGMGDAVRFLSTQPDFEHFTLTSNPAAFAIAANNLYQELVRQYGSELANTTDLDVLNLSVPPEEFDMELCAFINRDGYPCIEYNITTDDGYILKMHRIHGMKPSPTPYPVLFCHGMLTTGRDWVISGPGFSLAYELAAAGVDVWIISFRGTDISNEHVTFSKDDPAFWDFTFHEMGIYDIPKAIDTILEKTGAVQLNVVAFSQGGAAAYVTFSEMPVYFSAKIKRFVGLSPAVLMKGASNVFTSLVTLLLDYNYMLHTLYATTGQDNFLGATAPATETLGGLCYNIRNTVPFLCPVLFSLMFDFNNRFCPDDRALIPYLLYINLRVTSSKQILHFTQNVHEGNFYRYRENVSEDLELYDLTRAVNTEMHAFTSTDDHFVPTANIDDLKNRMTGTHLTIHRVHSYYHINFVFTQTAFDNLRPTFLGLLLNP